jgi:hypothetical protein
MMYVVGGLYKFTGPGDLVGKAVVVDNSTGKYVVLIPVTCISS